MSVPDAQSNDIYESLVTLNLLLKVLDELLLKKAIDFSQKQEWFDTVRNLQTELRKIQNILPIDAPALNSLIKQVKKVEYELVTLLRDIPKEKPNPEELKKQEKPNLDELKKQELINAIVNKPVTIQCAH